MQLLNDWSNDLLLLMNITQKAAIISFIIPTFHISETCLNQIKKHLTIVPSLVLVYFSGCCLSPGLHTHTYCINASLFTAAASHWSSLFIFCFISLHILFSSALFCTHQKCGFLDKIHINFSYCTCLYWFVPVHCWLLQCPLYMQTDTWQDTITVNYYCILLFDRIHDAMYLNKMSRMSGQKNKPIILKIQLYI